MATRCRTPRSWKLVLSSAPMRVRFSSLLFLCPLLLSGCFKPGTGDDEVGGTGDTDECAIGSEGCACTPGGSCDAGLMCSDMICVDASADTTERAPRARRQPLCWRRRADA